MRSSLVQLFRNGKIYVRCCPDQYNLITKRLPKTRSAIPSKNGTKQNVKFRFTTTFPQLLEFPRQLSKIVGKNL